MKINTMFKRSLSVLMCVVMLVSCWVFTVPEANAAAPTENYAYSVTVQTTDSADMADNNDQTVIIYGRGTNGTGADEELSNDTAVNYKSFEDDNGSYSKSGTGTFFPSKVTINLKFATSFAWVKREWKGTVTIKANNVQVYSKSLTITSDSGWGQGTGTGTVEVPKENYPKVSGVSITKTPPSTVTVPRTDEAIVSLDATAVAVDQYGVIWYEEPSFYTNPYIDGIVIQGGKMTVASNANSSDGQDRTIKLVAEKSTTSNVYKQEVSIKLINAKYTYTFKNDNGDIIKTDSISYGLVPPTPANPTKESDATYHYIFTGWSSQVKSLVRDTTYTAKYNKERHSFKNYIPDNNATCTEDGTKTGKCTCGYTDTVADPESALGHSYTSAVTKQPTCTEKGVLTFTCIRGDDSYDQPIDELHHDYVRIPVEPTCTEQGYVNNVCSRCDDSFKSDFTDALGHSYDEGVVETEPTCTEDGVMLYTCSRCHEEKREPIEKLGHDYTGWIVEKEASCTEDGWRHSDCYRCEETIVETLYAFGHSWSDWSVEKPETCTEDGSLIRTCSTCKAEEHDVIPKLGHNYEYKCVEPDDNVQGEMYYICKNCNEKFSCVLDEAGLPEVGEQIQPGSEATELVIPTTTFNNYIREESSYYNYINRGASLRIDKNLDEFTQPLRFASSMVVPENVEVIDFGYIYTREDKFKSMKKFIIGGPNVADFSMKDGHSSTFLTADGKTVKTFNIVINVDRDNWGFDYIARPYIIYSFAGRTFTVYDQCFSQRSVDDIAAAVMNSPTESRMVKDYIRNKIINR